MASKKKKRSANPPQVARKEPRAAAAPAGPTRKQQERAAQQSAERKEALRRRLVAAGLAVAAVAAVAAYVVVDRRGDAELRDTLTAGGCTVDTESDPTRPAGQNHVPNPSYDVNPPAGGDHQPAAARGGVYAGARVPADGLLVHSLEHGYVIAWHQPGLPEEQLQQLEELEQRHDGDVIVAERASLPVEVAATAWGHRLLCPSVQPEALDRFVEEHVGNGPEDVPRG